MLRLSVCFLLFINSLNVKCDDDEVKTEEETLSNEDNLGLEFESDGSKIYLNNTSTKTETTPSFAHDPGALCRGYRTCQECVTSEKYQCGWCHDFGCTHRPYELCPRTARKLGKLSADEACPRVVQEGPLVVPAGVRVNIKVKLHAPDPVIRNKELICQVKLQDRLTHLKGVLLSGTVFCYPLVLENKLNKYPYVGVLQIIWGGANPFSNAVALSVYRCEAMGADCERCRRVRAQFGCGWCRRVRACVLGDACAGDLAGWTLSRVTCNHTDKSLLYV